MVGIYRQGGSTPVGKIVYLENWLQNWLQNKQHQAIYFAAAARNHALFKTTLEVHRTFTEPVRLALQWSTLSAAAHFRPDHEEVEGASPHPVMREASRSKMCLSAQGLGHAIPTAVDQLGSSAGGFVSA